MSDASIDELFRRAVDLIKTANQPFEATYFLLGLLALRHGEQMESSVKWSESARWEAISESEGTESVQRAVAALQQEEATAEIGDALAELGLKSEDALRSRVRYGRQSMVDSSEDDLTQAFIGLTDDLSPNRLSVEELSRFVDRLLDVTAEATGKSSGEHYTPRPLANLMASILDPEGDASMYDPAMGTGGLLLSLLTQARQSSNGGRPTPVLCGQDINPQIAALAKINTYLHQADADIGVGDTLRDPKHVHNGSITTFDYVAANPPIRLRIDSDAQEKLRNDPYDRFLAKSIGRTADIAFVQHVAASLGDNGRGVVVVSPGLLQASGRERAGIRSLLEQGLIEAVVSLPAGMLRYTNISVALLVLNRDMSANGDVMMVEVNSLGDDGALSYAQQQRILASVNQRSEIDNFSLSVPVDTLLEKDAAISPSRYVAIESVNNLIGGIGERKKLRDIATVLRGNRLSHSEEGTVDFLRAGDISGGRVGVSDIGARAERTDIRKEVPELTSCQEGDILIKATDPFEGAVAADGLEGVPVNQQVIIIRLHSEYAELRQFLLEFIQSDTGYQLMSSLAGGTTIPRIRVDVLRDMPIPVPDTSLLRLVGDIHDVEDKLDRRRQKLEELRQQLFNMKDPDRSEAHVRKLSTEVQILADGLVQADDLSYKIRNFYPFPIAWGYRSLTGIQEESERREELRRIAENLLSFLGCIGLSVMRYEQGISTDAEHLSRKQLRYCWQGGATFGNWKDIAHLSGKQIRSNAKSPLASDFASIWFAGRAGTKTSEFYRITEELTAKRNIDSHGRGATRVERRERMHEFEEMVDEAYEAISFLVKYPIHLVRSIDSPWDKSTFEVSSLAYVGDHPSMQVKKSELSNPVSRGLLYIESGDDHWIPLHPWMSVAYCPTCKHRETYVVDKRSGTGQYKFKSLERGHPLDDEETRSRNEKHLDNILNS
jgi:type I restriction-modification system DNA methylase subunit